MFLNGLPQWGYSLSFLIGGVKVGMLGWREASFVSRSLSHRWGIRSKDHGEWVLVLNKLIRHTRVSQILIKTSQSVLHINALAFPSHDSIFVSLVFHFDSHSFLLFNQGPSISLALYLMLNQRWGFLPQSLTLLIPFIKLLSSLIWFLTVSQKSSLECIGQIWVI